MALTLTAFWRDVPEEPVARARLLWKYADLPVIATKERTRRRQPSLPDWGIRCWVCSKDPDAWHHIIPVACGGKNAAQNFVKLCLACHYAVHAGHQRPHSTAPHLGIDATIPVAPASAPLSEEAAFVYSHRPGVCLADIPEVGAAEFIDERDRESDARAQRLWNFRAECLAREADIVRQEREEFDRVMREAREIAGIEHTPHDLEELWDNRE